MTIASDPPPTDRRPDDLLLYPWPHQAELLLSRERYAIITAGRRSGKTEGVAMALLLRALAKPGIYWWVGPTGTQIEVGIDTFRKVLHEVGEPYQFAVGAATYTLANGSTIKYLTGGGDKSLQGRGLCGVCMDEVNDLKKSVWYNDLEPTLLDTGGWAVLFGKPKGYNWLWELSEKVKTNPEWLHLSYPSWANPTIDKAEIDAKRPIIGEAAWAQEYGGKFVAAETALWPQWYFDDVLIDGGEFPAAFQRSALAVDLSEGNIKSDWQGVTLLGVVGGKHYLHCENLRTSATELLRRVKALSDMYLPEKIVVDATASRLFVADEFRRLWPNGGMPRLVLLKEHEHKETRIQRLATPLHQKIVRVLNNEGGREYVREGRDFPCGDYDDLLDSHEMAWRGLAAA